MGVNSWMAVEANYNSRYAKTSRSIKTPGRPCQSIKRHHLQGASSSSVLTLCLPIFEVGLPSLMISTRPASSLSSMTGSSAASALTLAPACAPPPLAHARFPLETGGPPGVRRTWRGGQCQGQRPRFLNSPTILRPSSIVEWLLRVPAPRSNRTTAAKRSCLLRPHGSV